WSIRIVARLGGGLPTTATTRFRRSTSSENEPVGPAGLELLNTPMMEQSVSGEAPHSATQVSASDRSVWALTDEARPNSSTITSRATVTKGSSPRKPVLPALCDVPSLVPRHLIGLGQRGQGVRYRHLAAFIPLQPHAVEDF